MQTKPVTIPRTIDPQGVMKPEAGVAATRPEIAPEHQPTMDHFFANLKSRRTQVIEANMAHKFVFQQAITARRLAPKALPPLNPSHPNQRNIVPRTIKETLWGRKLTIIFSCLLPRTKEYARPDIPEPISTGPPPA